jgi:hypothetical protein
MTNLRRQDIWKILLSSHKDKKISIVKKMESFYIHNLDVVNILMGLSKVDFIEKILLKNNERNAHVLMLINIVEGVLNNKTGKNFQNFKYLNEDTNRLESNEYIKYIRKELKDYF